MNDCLVNFVQAKPDWKKIELDFISGMSRKEICDKYKIKYNTLDSKIKRGNWTQSERNIERKTDEKLEEKLSETIAERQASFIEKQYRFFSEILDDEIERYKSRSSNPEYKLSMSDLKEVVRLARQAINLFDSKTESNVTITDKVKELDKSELKKELIERGLNLETIESLKD